MISEESVETAKVLLYCFTQICAKLPLSLHHLATLVSNSADKRPPVQKQQRQWQQQLQTPKDASLIRLLFINSTMETNGTLTRTGSAAAS